MTSSRTRRRFVCRALPPLTELVPSAKVQAAWEGNHWLVWPQSSPRRLVDLSAPLRTSGFTLAHRAPNPEGELRGSVAGYWDLATSEVLEATRDGWPFGGRLCAREALFPEDALVVLLDDGQIFVPRIPTFAEAEAWILDQTLQVPPWKCGCGAMHHTGGPVVGLHVFSEGSPPFVLKGVRFIVEKAHGGYQEALVTPPLVSLQDLAWLEHVGLGGRGVQDWNARAHG